MPVKHKFADVIFFKNIHFVHQYTSNFEIVPIFLHK